MAEEDQTPTIETEEKPKDQAAKKEEKPKSVLEIAGPIFNEMADNGATRNEIVDRLVEVTNKSRNYVMLQYNMLADFYGKHPSTGENAPRGKKADAFRIFEKHIVANMADDALATARKAAATEALKETELKKASLEMHMRNFLKKLGYELSRGSSNARGDTAEKTELVKKLLEEGKSRGDILKVLITKYSHTEAGAASTYQNIVRANDLQRGSRAQYRDPCWNWFKTNIECTREEALKQFSKIGASAVMASNYWQTFSLAKELADDLVEVEEEEAA